MTNDNPDLDVPFQSGPAWERVTEMVYRAFGLNEAASSELMADLIEWIGERDAAIKEGARKDAEALREALRGLVDAIGTCFCSEHYTARGRHENECHYGALESEVIAARAGLTVTDTQESR